MTPDERARAVAALIAERFGLPTPPPRPRVQTSAAGASNPGGAPYSLTEMPQMSILIVTEADVEAEAARTHGRAWPHMDPEQRSYARESARKALVWAAYPKLVAAHQQLQEEVAAAIATARGAARSVVHYVDYEGWFPNDSAAGQVPDVCADAVVAALLADGGEVA